QDTDQGEVLIEQDASVAGEEPAGHAHRGRARGCDRGAVANEIDRGVESANLASGHGSKLRVESADKLAGLYLRVCEADGAVRDDHWVGEADDGAMNHDRRGVERDELLAGQTVGGRIHDA